MSATAAGSSPPPHIVVVGGGVSGLAAALALTGEDPAAVRVTVLDAAGEVGGKLRVSDVAGVPVDEGAESMLARRPEGVALARAAGLGDQLVDPATTAARVWTRGRLRPLPAGQVLGVPADLRALAATRLLTAAELGRVPLDLILPRTSLDGGDVSVAHYVSARLGRPVVDRLVEPLLGGVYAGRADALSLRATVPQLAAAASRSRSLLTAARQVRAAAGPSPGPVFASLRGGMGQLPAALAARLAGEGASVHTGATVRGLARTATGWRLTTGPHRSGGQPAGRDEIHADAVVLGVPAPAASRLLAATAPTAAAEIGAIDYASVAVVTLALPRAALAGLAEGSGFLVPAVEGRTVKAATFSSAKWQWYADAGPDIAVVRLSVGRHGEERDVQRDDRELVAAAAADLADALGRPGGLGPLLDARVSRWGGSLPQYAVGHLDRVRRIRAAVAEQPGLAVCGAAYDGVGVPACVASGRAAAASVLAHLRGTMNG